MSKLSNAEKQRKFVAAQKAAGLRRVVLWARPEDVEALKLAAKQPQSLSKLRDKVELEFRKKLKREIEAKVAAKLKAETERALRAQRRSQARGAAVGVNRPPQCIRFERTPPAALRGPLRAAGWLYDPVACIWHLPDDPAAYAASERLLEGLTEFGVVKLAREPERDVD